jgi:thiamine-monophosphate kinase
MPGEFDFLDWVRGRQRKSPLVCVGSGDDLAVLRWPADDLLLVGVDQVLDTVHFDSTIHSPRAIGIKAMNRNLSDCAAMACLPAAAVATVALPVGIGVDYARELYLGLEEAGDKFDCPIVGGDTASWAGKLAVTVTIFGRSAGVEPIRRGGAKPGDTIYVTGPLGGSFLGRHMTFEPRVALARQLAEHAPPTAMIDLSDGLSRDLGHICSQSGIGAIIDAERIPIHPDAVAMSVNMSKDGRSPLQHALHDGEDYELLFTATSPYPSPGIPGEGTRGRATLIPIGRITAEPTILLRESNRLTPLEPLAWQHNL